jgi:glycosyltransferase involved in cell wall biosynthesis
MLVNKNILFIWNEIPIYAAEQIRYLENNTNHNYIVVSNIKNLSHKKSISKILKTKLIIYSSAKTINLVQRKLCKINLDFIFTSGWAYKDIRDLTRSIKKKNENVRNVMMVDNCKKNNLKQFFGKFYFKNFIDPHYDCFWVPGKSSVHLLKYLGTQKKIVEGLYSYNKDIFYSFKNLNKRASDFIFIGQLIKRKNFLLAIDAFRSFSKIQKNSRLFIVGRNPNNLNLNNYKFANIYFKINQSPKQISRLLNKCKFFVLPSKEDHWPLALLESIACNCISIISKNIGSISDFLPNKNIYVCKDLNPDSLQRSFLDVCKYDDKDLREVTMFNFKIKKKYHHNNFLINFNKIIHYLKKK